MPNDTPRGPLTPRPTIYRGVQMRSRLEAAWAEQFDTLGWEWEYEPFAVADQGGQYLPDFRLTIHGQPVYAEVKPAPFADPHERGFVGIDAELWNAAWASFAADVYGMAERVRANTECVLFLACIGSDSDGRAAIYAAHPDPADHSDTTLVVPCLCSNEGRRCVGLVAKPLITGCPKHKESWRPLRPVDSLYAPNGFLHYPSKIVRLDRIDHLIRDGGSG